MPRSKVISMEKLEQLESGDKATVSGIYTSNHSACNFPDVWLQRDQQLPVCAQCGKSATYRLRKQIHHISEDPDFA
jgi:hypothetical protein